MKTGKRYINRISSVIKCPDCDDLLVKGGHTAECATFKLGEWKKTDKGWCDRCQAWFLIPDLSNLKLEAATPLMYELLQDMMEWDGLLPHSKERIRQVIAAAS